MQAARVHYTVIIILILLIYFYMNIASRITVRSDCHLSFLVIRISIVLYRILIIISMYHTVLIRRDQISLAK